MIAETMGDWGEEMMGDWGGREFLMEKLREIVRGEVLGEQRMILTRVENGKYSSNTNSNKQSQTNFKSFQNPPSTYIQIRCHLPSPPSKPNFPNSNLHPDSLTFVAGASASSWLWGLSSPVVLRTSSRSPWSLTAQPTVMISNMVREREGWF